MVITPALRWVRGLKTTARHAWTSATTKRAVATFAVQRGCAAGAISGMQTLGALVKAGLAITLAPLIKVLYIHRCLDPGLGFIAVAI